MPSTQSTDIFDVYRGVEEKITSFTNTPIKNGNVYFAYDNDASIPRDEITPGKLYFDANLHRYVVSGGGDVSFITASPSEPPTEDLDGYYEFALSDINARKVSVDNILITDDNILYRVVRVDNEIAYTYMIAGGGGGGGAVTNPVTLQWLSNFPNRCIDTKMPSAVLLLNTKSSSVSQGILKITCNGTEVTELTNNYQEVGRRIEIPISIPTKYLNIGSNEILASITIRLNGENMVSDCVASITVFHAEFKPTQDWNPRRVFGTDTTTVDVQKTITYPYTFTGLSTGIGEDKYVSGIINTYIDDELVDNGTQIYGSGSRVLDCTALDLIEHGNHKLRYEAKVAVGGEEFEVTSYTYDIIWATEEGGRTPIIISPFDAETDIENYSVINIPYLVYQKNTEQSLVHLFINGEEIPTSPITTAYDRTASSYQNWRITNYIADQTKQPNSFTMQVGNTKVQRTFYVNITPSALDLDADNSDDLLLYLSAQGRSNKEALVSRRTWSFTNSSKDTYNAILEGFNWYNDGWQIDDEGADVLRLNNGATVRIPFNGILQTVRPQPGLTIEIEFKCRNAMNYSKLLSLQDQERPGQENIPVEDREHIVIKSINYEKDAQGNDTTRVANAVGQIFNNGIGFVFGTQEAFFAASDKTVNVRYADNDKVKVSIVADDATNLLYIYINGVLSGAERYSNNTSFQAQANELIFNSTYCDLDLYNIRIYKKPLSFDGIVKNWVGDAPDLDTKLTRYEENNITKTFTVNGTQYVTLDYEKTRAYCKKIADRYIAAGRPDGMPRALPIAVVTTYGDGELPFNKANKQSCGIRVWDPNGDFMIPGGLPTEDEDGNKIYYYGFKARSIEFSVQGTSSQGYPRRNFKAKIKEYGGSLDSQQLTKYPYEFTTWDGDDEHKDIWSNNKTSFGSLGFAKIKKIDIGNGTAENKFCWKADFMDSSSSHNTPLANYVNELYQQNTGYDLRHPMNIIFNTSIYRTTVYGWPMLLFHDRQNSAEAPEFVGKYNFNTDKSATGSFGFDIDQPHQVYAASNTQLPLPTEVKKPLFDTNGDPVWKKNKDGTFVTDGDGNKVQETEKVIEDVLRDPTYADICECWELTSNQHGFTGFRRNDFDTVIDGQSSGHKELDFYNFWENRYSIYDFDPVEMYDEDTSTGKVDTINKLKKYMKNIRALSEWIYSTDVHPWDTNDLTSVNHHKLTQMTNSSTFSYTVDETDNTKVHLLKDYYVYTDGARTTVRQIPESAFSGEYVTDESSGVTEYVLTITDPTTSQTIPYANLYADEINAVLPHPIFYHTRDLDWDITIDEEHPETIVSVNKTYYLSNAIDDNNSGIPAAWYHRRADTILTQKTDSDHMPVWETDPDTGDYILNDKGEKIPVMEEIIRGYATVVINPESNTEIDIANVYEEFTRDTKNYRLSKYRAEFYEHLNFNYMAAYFILTELFIMYDSREKNMMIATWGPETPGGNYIWYPIFYDMDTQLGINNSGTVYWDYDVNAQDEGIFSGAGSVLWDNFYTCFLPEVRTFYINWRNANLNEQNCVKFYNTNSADRWTPIMKNADTFYKYIACTIDGLGYVDKDGKWTIDSGQYFYCAQGDRSLNRAAFFRNRFNYKDSEWLGGSYRTQGGKSIEMRYDANWTGTSDPEASTWTTEEEKSARRRAGLDGNAYFDITPYLTQYTSVYYDELARTGGRYDIQKPPAEGYVRVHPLESIEATINSGLPLSQQLVYIYGAEFLRDIGDLSLKYLDRLTISAAIRLNKLILGNDNPLYRNDGATLDSIKIDSPYYSSSGANVLNSLAKALLQYVDLSNLRAMAGGVDFSGCLKLISVRALGSSLTNITLPEGNVVERLHLPNTNTDFTLVQGQRLSKIVRNRAECITSTATDNIVADGLYLEGITDNMNVSVNNNVLSSYMNNSTVAVGNYTKTNINNYHLEAGVLGFHSYEILDYLVKTKIQMLNDPSAVNNDKTLRIRLLDVNWSPYELLDETAVRNSDTVYYVRQANSTYRVLGSTETFDYARKNLGGVYRKTENRLLYDPLTGTYKEGLPNLDILQLFIKDYNAGDKLRSNGKYIFMDYYQGDGIEKFLPHIGGEIYLDNDIAINEYEIYQVQKAYNSVLNMDDTPMTICAKTVEDCPRVTFVEINNGVQNQIAMYRSNSANTKVFANADSIIEERARQHYDFRGWVNESDAIEYDPTFIVKDENGVVISTSNSIVAKNSDILKHLVVPNHDDINYRDLEGSTLLSDLRFGNGPATYYAVFTLHEYKVTYVLDEQKYAENPDDSKAYELQLVPSGDLILTKPCTVIPWSNDTALPLTHAWIFKGWCYKGETKVRDLTRVRAQSDLVLYPVFEEDLIYNHPIDAEYIEYGLRNNEAYIFNITKHFGGKVCIPSEVDGYPVVSICGSNKRLVHGQIVYDRFAAGTSMTREGLNGFQENDDITHIFFQGSNDGTSKIRSIAQHALKNMKFLVYLDMPASLVAFGDYCCAEDYRLTFASLEHVSTLGSYAFSYTNLPHLDIGVATNQTLSVMGLSSNGMGLYPFIGAGWSDITFGNNSNPYTGTTMNSVGRNGSSILVDDYSEPSYDGSYGLKKVIIYARDFDSTYIDRDQNAIIPSAAREYVEIMIYQVG